MILAVDAGNSAVTLAGARTITPCSWSGCSPCAA